MSTTEVNETSSIAAYYDADVDRCLKDFVRGNQRISVAIELVVSQITNRVQTILDVGCGIGISSDAYCRKRPWVRVHGVDISLGRIEAARKMFRNPRLRFDVSPMDTPLSETPFDLIALLDVYEHIPRMVWPEFNEIIARSVSDHGIVVLTLPSPLHQSYLANEKPRALQVVDETVELDDILSVATACDGVVTKYEYVSIWKSNDYVHAVIEKAPHHENVADPETFKARLRRKHNFWTSRIQESVAVRRRKCLARRAGWK